MRSLLQITVNILSMSADIDVVFMHYWPCLQLCL